MGRDDPRDSDVARAIVASDVATRTKAISLVVLLLTTAAGQHDRVTHSDRHNLLDNSNRVHCHHDGSGARGG